jgi:hypothetical protein
LQKKREKFEKARRDRKRRVVIVNMNIQGIQHTTHNIINALLILNFIFFPQKKKKNFERMSALQQVNPNADTSKFAFYMNVKAAVGLADVLKTNLGPKGTLKMLVSGSGDIKLTKDGNTLLHQMQVNCVVVCWKKKNRKLSFCLFFFFFFFFFFATRAEREKKKKSKTVFFFFSNILINFFFNFFFYF